MVRGLIRHCMRGSIPKDEQDSFVLPYQDEDVWKKLADFSDPNDAYILFVDAADNIRWRTHGKVPDQQALNALRDEISNIPISPAPPRCNIGRTWKGSAELQWQECGLLLGEIV
jgi:hypothetical protein